MHHCSKYLFLFFKITIIPILILLNSCGIYKPVDARKVPPEVDLRVQKNIEEGRGLGGKNLFGGGSTNFEFATSNELWRATLEVLDFLPLANVDYAGGIIITDWYNEGTSNEESIKITIRFLSNEIRADAVSVLIYKKICKTANNCNISKIRSATLEEEIKLSILRKATLLEKNRLDKTSKAYRKSRGVAKTERYAN